MRTETITPEAFDKAADLFRRREALKVTMRECAMTLAEKLAIRRQIDALEVERRKVLGVGQIIKTTMESDVLQAAYEHASAKVTS